MSYTMPHPDNPYPESFLDFARVRQFSSLRVIAHFCKTDAPKREFGRDGVNEISRDTVPEGLFICMISDM
jgi:hypothetical protein